MQSFDAQATIEHEIAAAVSRRWVWIVGIIACVAVHVAAVMGAMLLWRKFADADHLRTFMPMTIAMTLLAIAVAVHYFRLRSALK